MELKVRRRLGSFHCVAAELKAAPTRWLLAACCRSVTASRQAIRETLRLGRRLIDYGVCTKVLRTLHEVLFTHHVKPSVFGILVNCFVFLPRSRILMSVICSFCLQKGPNKGTRKVAAKNHYNCLPKSHLIVILLGTCANALPQVHQRL